MSPEQNQCRVGFAVDRQATTAILDAIATARRTGEAVSQAPEPGYFRLSVPSQHEVLTRQSRLCAAAILNNECPGFTYNPLNPQSYQIIKREPIQGASHDQS